MAEDFDEFLGDVREVMEDNGYDYTDEGAITYFIEDFFGFDDEEAEEALYA